MADRMTDPHPNAANAGAPGASGPDDPRYDREPQIGDEAGLDADGVPVTEDGA